MDVCQGGELWVGGVWRVGCLGGGLYFGLSLLGRRGTFDWGLLDVVCPKTGVEE